MAHKEILQRNHLYLKENLEVEKILDELFQRGVLSLTDKEKCKGKHGPAAQSEELLCILPRKGRQGYDIFVQILEKVQPYIKEHLEGRDSSDSHTASTPDQQMVDPFEQLKMENARLTAEALRREKSHFELKASHEQVKQEHKMLKNQQLLEDLGAAGIDRAKLPHSRLVSDISHEVIFHTLRFPGQNISLQCPSLQLHVARTNTEVCHVTTGGELINSPPVTPHRHVGTLQIYQGTCASTPIPLCPSPSNVAPVPHTPRYWETQSRVHVLSGGYLRWLVLEMGVVEESQVDTGWCVGVQRRSWCVSVWSCNTHQGSLCTSVWQPEKVGKCYSNTMSDTPGTHATLHFGLVLDVARGRLAFIDLNREFVVAKVDAEWNESLLPMFSAGEPNYYTVKMKLISGADITMTDTKKSLIRHALK